MLKTRNCVGGKYGVVLTLFHILLFPLPPSFAKGCNVYTGRGVWGEGLTHSYYLPSHPLPPKFYPISILTLCPYPTLRFLPYAPTLHSDSYPMSLPYTPILTLCPYPTLPFPSTSALPAPSLRIAGIANRSVG